MSIYGVYQPSTAADTHNMKRNGSYLEGGRSLSVPGVGGLETGHDFFFLLVTCPYRVMTFFFDRLTMTAKTVKYANMAEYAFYDL